MNGSALVAGEIGSYKPGHRHWEEFFARTGADRAGHVHVAQSHFHDVVPANERGLGMVITVRANGGPGTTEAIETRDWFVSLSKSMGAPAIPIINSANKGATLVFVQNNAAAGTPNVDLILAELRAA